MAENNILEMRNISKEFFGIYALQNVTFSVKQGEIHALCGENGAGKSTLMKILSGVHRYGSYTGDVIVKGQKRQFNNVSDAEKAGIGIIYQELNLVSEMDIAENIFLNSWPVKVGVIDASSMYFKANQLCAELGITASTRTKIKHLGVGVQQMVEIAKSLAKNVDILVLDEPTASLTESEVDILMDLLRNLKARGVSCIYISHKLSEIFRICDTVTVLRDGETVGTYNVADVDENQLIKAMVGREIHDRFPYHAHEIGEPVMEVKDYNVYDSVGRKIISDINFRLNKGEILGISGLMGAGRTELALSLFGAYGARKTGEVSIFGEKVTIRRPADAIGKHIAMVTEDRKSQGLVLMQNVSDNIVMASLDQLSKLGVLDLNKQHVCAKKYSDEVRVKAPSLEAQVKSLSGGNQQKVVLAKWLMTQPKILFLDEPTRGIDVGAKYEIYSIMMNLVEAGYSIIMISSELPEILGMSDRILVMREGRINGELKREEATQELVMQYATGGNLNGKV